MKQKVIIGIFFLEVLILSFNNISSQASENQYFIYLPIVFLDIPSWREVGTGSASGNGISNNAGDSFAPSIAVAPNGTPYVAWYDSSNGSSYEIYVKKWNGSSWVDVGANSSSGGGISNNTGDSTRPSITIAPNNTPYVAWSDNSGGAYSEIYVKKWDGSGWVEVGTGSASNGGISNNPGPSHNPSISVAPNGTPYVAWTDYSSNEEIYVKKWNGSSWTEVGLGSASSGGISDNPGSSSQPDIAIDSNNMVYIAWTDSSAGDSEIYLRMWNGVSWIQLSNSATGGGISNNTSGSWFPSIAISFDGVPYVAWENVNNSDYQIYVRAWNGYSWTQVGYNSANGGGISNNDGYSSTPSIAIGPNGTPYVAWEDDSGGGLSEIFVRMWNGSYWAQIGGNSAFGGGISNNNSSSRSASIFIDSNNSPYVTWYDKSSNNWEIYVRQYVE